LLASESNSFAEFSFITLFNRLSQVGIIVHGTTVDDLILGGPAYNSKKLAQGDVIIKVDSVEATEENINDLLIGKDVS
jgi:C-terminal processing protease CtpA/Prc